MRFRQKSKKRQIADTVTKFAKGARKTVTGWGVYKTAKDAISKAPAPVKALPVVAGVGAAGAVAAKKRRGGEPTPA